MLFEPAATRCVDTCAFWPMTVCGAGRRGHTSPDDRAQARSPITERGVVAIHLVSNGVYFVAPVLHVPLLELLVDDDRYLVSWFESWMRGVRLSDDL